MKLYRLIGLGLWTSVLSFGMNVYFGYVRAHSRPMCRLQAVIVVTVAAAVIGLSKKSYRSSDAGMGQLKLKPETCYFVS